MRKKNYLLYLIIPLIILSCNDPVIIKKPEISSQVQTCGQLIENVHLVSCGLPIVQDQIEVWTWNLQFFPKSTSTEQSVIDIIDYYQPDIIAFQEIDNNFKMQQVLNSMAVYEGWVIDLSGSLDLAFAYNTCTISSIEEPEIILQDEVWPRPPVRWKAKVGADTFNLINIHLKCCGDGIEDRQEATTAIRQYMLEELANQAGILLGDFNDDITDESIATFYNDSINFVYTDRHVSSGSPINWSYPSWPSDLDHILINQALFNKIDTASTLLIDQCFPNYSRDVSDHRIVSALINL